MDDIIVYSDGTYTLGQKDGAPYITVNGEIYKLTCSPYEPCLYITDKNGSMTAVHNSFDPYSLLSIFADGSTVTSITGREYTAKDFCDMVAYSANLYDISIDEAEKVFCKKKTEANKTEQITEKKYGDKTPWIDTSRIITDDPFNQLIENYPDCVIDYCIVINEHISSGYNAHRMALTQACRKLFVETFGEVIWRYDVGKSEALLISAEELFAPAGDVGKSLNYRAAFLKPPYTNNYTDEDFDKINDALFPNGIDTLEIYKWTTDWSEYFDEGHEWWGTLCVTVYDKSLDRFVVIMASATD